MLGYGLTTGSGITNADTSLLTLPLSFLRSGYYYYYSGNLGTRQSVGYYWESRAYSTTNANYLYFFSTSLSPQSNATKGNGFAVRCVAR